MSLFLISCSKECPDCVCGDCPSLDCDECPLNTEIVYQNVTNTKYVCEDGRVYDDKESCFYTAPSEIKLVKTNEKGTGILESSLVSSCIFSREGGSIYFKRGKISKTVDYEIKEGNGNYSSVYNMPGTYEGIVYFAVCSSCYYGDFTVKPDKIYVLRMRFDTYDGKVEYSNEYIIDTTENSDFMKDVCPK